MVVTWTVVAPESLVFGGANVTPQEFDLRLNWDIGDPTLFSSSQIIEPVPVVVATWSTVPPTLTGGASPTVPGIVVTVLQSISPAPPCSGTGNTVVTVTPSISVSVSFLLTPSINVTVNVRPSITIWL